MATCPCSWAPVSVSTSPTTPCTLTTPSTVRRWITPAMSAPFWTWSSPISAGATWPPFGTWYVRGHLNLHSTWEGGGRCSTQCYLNYLFFESLFSILMIVLLEWAGMRFKRHFLWNSCHNSKLISLENSHCAVRSINVTWVVGW